MADEIKLKLSLEASKNGASVNSVGDSQGVDFVLDMAGEDMTTITGTASTSYAAIGKGACPVGRWMMFINRAGRDGTSTLTSIVLSNSAGVGGKFATVPPGHAAVIPADAEIYVGTAADTADWTAVQVEF